MIGTLLWKINNNLRDFPWRHKITPYRIMIAEFMLQRTRAEQVESVYIQFIKRYPTLASLSRAKIKDVAQYTKHLGIHWRAKHFIAAAKFIVKEYKGKIPSKREKLLAIPGVGEYVAGAILAVAFQNRAWVIDTNIARFLNRFNNYNLTGELRRKQLIITAAKKLFNFEDPRNLLFSLLDFTALICTPSKPKCHQCPIRRRCKFGNKTNALLSPNE